MDEANVVDVPDGFESPESATIVSARYDKRTEVMTVTFKRENLDQRTYRYSNIPLSLWAEFAAASSKGSFFSKMIRPMYAGKAVAAV